MKSEPDVYAISDLKRDRTEMWEGVRNYQARNFMRAMKKGDWVLFYHSNAKPSGISGVARVSKEHYPDPTQYDRKSKYYDEKSVAYEEQGKEPRWSVVEVRFVEAFNEILSLSVLKANPAFKNMRVVQKGSRLSVQPVDKNDFQRVLEAAGAKTEI